MDAGLAHTRPPKPMAIAAHRWIDLWNTESKLIDQDGRELGRVQAFDSHWKSFTGPDHQVGTSGTMGRDEAKRMVEASL